MSPITPTPDIPTAHPDEAATPSEAATEPTRIRLGASMARAKAWLPAAAWTAGLAVAGIAALVFAPAVRAVEARIATWLLGATFAEDSMFTTVAGEPGIGYQIADGWLAMPVTTALSGAYVLGVVLLITAALLFIPRLPRRAALTVGAAGTLLTAVIVQARLLTIAIIWGEHGINSYYDAIAWTGIVVFVLGVLACIGAYFFITVQRTRAITTA
ncbi:hypothetical protein [Microbacterium sp. TPU 3598]|uniref:hypothetical protein n=1 Tax=Microbacterium sp. TPU 3598 TaxID=1938334 RepID=UPI0012FD7BF7|nr:hypothetical protein [Microbacterium sp. TPU 3598]